MAAWASLSGYLFIKQGGGGLSRLKSRKKQWCVLDESRGQLLHHKCEEDARCKPPVGYIELRGAAITLDLDNQNQFVVIVDNKEVYLTAENHESMMIWLMALQSKRDQFAKLLSSGGDTPTAAAGAGGPRRGVGPLGAEETRERVGRARGHSPRPSLPNLVFPSSSFSPFSQTLPEEETETVMQSPPPGPGATFSFGRQRRRSLVFLPSSQAHHQHAVSPSSSSLSYGRRRSSTVYFSSAVVTSPTAASGAPFDPTSPTGRQRCKSTVLF